MDTAQPTSHASQLDPEVFGEEIGADRRPGEEFPLEHPLGIDDPTLDGDGTLHDDDVATRADREIPDVPDER
jgi:hypothetical protein